MNAPYLLSRSFFSELSRLGTWSIRDAAVALLAPPALRLALSKLVAAPEGRRDEREVARKQELQLKVILSPPAISAVATCQKIQQGKKMTKNIRADLSPSNRVEQATGATWF